jgi:hypothetical protein
MLRPTRHRKIILQTTLDDQLKRKKDNMFPLLGAIGLSLVSRVTDAEGGGSKGQFMTEWRGRKDEVLVEVEGAA